MKGQLFKSSSFSKKVDPFINEIRLRKCKESGNKPQYNTVSDINYFKLREEKLKVDFKAIKNKIMEEKNEKENQLMLENNNLRKKINDLVESKNNAEFNYKVKEKEYENLLFEKNKEIEDIQSSIIKISSEAQTQIKDLFLKIQQLEEKLNKNENCEKNSNDTVQKLLKEIKYLKKENSSLKNKLGINKTNFRSMSSEKHLLTNEIKPYYFNPEQYINGISNNKY